MQGITHIRLCNYGSILLEENCLCTCSTNINANHIGFSQALALLSS